MNSRTRTSDAPHVSLLRRYVLSPDDLQPGIEQRVLDDDNRHVPDASSRRFLAAFDPLADMPGPWRRPRTDRV